MRSSTYVVTVVVALVAMSVTGWYVVRTTSALRHVGDQLALHHTVDGRLRVTFATWLEFASAGMLAQERVTEDTVRHLQALRARLDRQLLGLNLGFLGAMAGFVALPLMARPRSRGTVQHIVIVSGVLLGLGLWAPMLTLSVHYTAPVVGRIMLESTTKGILESVWLFVTGPQWYVGLVILVFSAVLPLVKLSLMQGLLLRPRMAGPLAHGLSSVGKWSMADVFLAAVTVALFAYSSSANTDARAGVGLLYFGGYCVVSLIGSLMLSRQQALEAGAARA